MDIWVAGWTVSDARHRFDPGTAFPAIGHSDQRLSRSKPAKHHHRIIHFLLGRTGRLIRARVLSTRSDTYIEAARAPGCKSASDHGSALIQCTTAGIRSGCVGGFGLHPCRIKPEFFGLGDPSGKSWGTMLYFARASGAFISDAWKWWVLPTGLMITLTVLSLGIAGYSLEQRMVRSAS